MKIEYRRIQITYTCVQVEGKCYMSNETNHYKIGDVLDFQQEGKEHIKVMLVDRHANGMFVGFSVDCLSELKPMNEEDSNRGGYDASDLCKYLNSNEFMNILPG